MKILTFDLEDWFHILDFEETASTQSWEKMESRVEKNTDRILSLLEERNQSATWFCLGWIAEKYPLLIKKISQNHEIACHSMEHSLIYSQHKEEAREDIHRNISVLENITGKKVIAYRAPGFSFTKQTPWLADILHSENIIYDSSVFPAKRNHGGYSDFPVAVPCRLAQGESMIKEFPMNIYMVGGRKIVFSGGGYFRFLPYMIIKQLMDNSPYVMTYFHPRDFDSEQPVLKDLPLKRKFMSYTGLKKSFSKLNRLLIDYKFITITQAGESINWEDAPLIKL